MIEQVALGVGIFLVIAVVIVTVVLRNQDRPDAREARDEEIVGLRCWRVGANNVLLPVFSNHPGLYLPREIMDAGAKAVGENLGFHAYKDFNDLSASYNLNERDFVVATVSMWGDVDEHERGYRSRYAYPRSFFRITHGQRSYDVDALANAWGVEIGGRVTFTKKAVA